MKTIKPYSGLVINEDVKFESGEYDFFAQKGIIIGADNITIDGNGATFIGGFEKGKNTAETNTEEFGYGENQNPDNAKELGYFGTGILIEGRTGITIKNLNVKGFDMGLLAKYSDNITVENVDFTGCFHDPDWGWDNHGFHGAILFDHVENSTVKDCRANDVWDAINLQYSNRNTIINNDFSHTSDTGIKLWAACENTINDNDFSYGLRISPGEVHARDSSSVLIESGSNDNVFKRNDMTHGGDGLFIRVLNGWMSIGNLFEENDCSYANNNAVEAWSDGNTYIRNKANYSSYGFWLGNSDNTVLIGNEVAYNGDMFHNAPESFGNSGIAVVNGSGSHFVLEDNDIHDNVGPGIAIRFRKNYPSDHWVIQNNKIYNNKSNEQFTGHGIYTKNAKNLTFAQNEITGNDGEAIFYDGNVADIVYLDGKDNVKPEGVLEVSPVIVFEGDEVSIKVDNNGTNAENRLSLGDGTVTTETCIKHTYDSFGLYRINLTSENGSQACLDFKNLYVLPKGEVIDCTELEKWEVTTGAENYGVVLSNVAITEQSVYTVLAGGNEHTLLYPSTKDMNKSLGDNNSFRFALKFTTDAEPNWSSDYKKPVVRLYSDEENYIEFVPTKPLLDMGGDLGATEAKDGWRIFSVDIDGNDLWVKNVVGEGVKSGVINYFSIEFAAKYEGYTQIYLDNISLGNTHNNTPMLNNMASNKYDKEYPKAIYSDVMEYADAKAPILGVFEHYGDITSRFATDKDGYYGVDFGAVRVFDRVSVYFYENNTKTTKAHGEKLPTSIWLEVDLGFGYQEVEGTRRESVKLGKNVFAFEMVRAQKARVRFVTDGKAPVAIYGIDINDTTTISKEYYDIESNIKVISKLQSFKVKLNKHFNQKGCSLGDMIAKVFIVNDEGKLDECLFETKIAENNVKKNQVNTIEAAIDTLESGKKYALALGQINLAESYTEGDCYRWIAGHSGIDETFAIYDQGETKPTDHNWGTAWLQVCCENQIADYSHDSEHVGTRFGVKKMEYRYQTFKMPDTYKLAFDGDVSSKTGWKPQSLEDYLTIKLNEATKVSAIDIWMNEPCEIEILVDGQFKTYVRLKEGFNEVLCYKKSCTEIIIKPVGLKDSTIINQIELIKKSTI